jgi:hypothetical protein
MCSLWHIPITYGRRLGSSGSRRSSPSSKSPSGSHCRRRRFGTGFGTFRSSDRVARTPRREIWPCSRSTRLLRDAAYAQGRATFPALAADPTFRDFVCLYIAEGYKRSRNHVSLGNSDPQVVRLAGRWIRALALNPVTYCLQYHADEDFEQLQRFWSAELAVAPTDIRFQRKSNSGGLIGRNWRSEHGVLTVRVGDTLLRARLQGWMDCLQDQWLDSPAPGRSAAW